MDYLEDFIFVQKTAIKNTFKNIRYIVYIIIAIFAGSLTINIASNILNFLLTSQLFSIIKGLLMYALRIFIISFIMSISYNSIKRNSNFIDLSSQEKARFMYKIISVGFIFYIVELVLSMIRLNVIYIYATPFIILAFNALPETIYLENYDGLNSILQSLEFLKNNIFNWAVPNLLVYIIFRIFNISYILDFNTLLSRNPIDLLISIIVVIIYSIYIIYRGNMYEVLKDSSKRKREYMRNFE